MTQPTKPTLTASDPPDWYECRYVFEPPDDRVARYWDGERLRLNPRNSSWYGLEAYADFRRLVYAEPTPQPGVAELVEALKEAIGLIEFFHGKPSWQEYQQSPEMQRLRKALAAVEAAETQEKGE